MDIIQALTWRYAAKRMTGQTVPEEIIDKILRAAHLAPSGVGLQPYEIIVVTNPKWKEKILPVAMNQQQVIQSSHLLVFAAWQSYTPERINRVFDYLNEQRNEVTAISDNQRKFAINYFGKLTEEEQFHHAAKQANIALGLAVAAAALEQVDAAPMEGFNAPALDELLGLKEKGLRSSMLMAVGYRDETNDWNLKLKKIRKPLTEFVTELR